MEDPGEGGREGLKRGLIYNFSPPAQPECVLGHGRTITFKKSTETGVGAILNFSL